MTSANPRTDSAESASTPGVSKQLTASEVADILRIGTYAVIILCRTGQLRASKPGKSWLIDPADLRAYLESGRNDSAESA